MCGREELGSLTRGFGPWVTATAPLLKVAVDRAQEEKARVFPVPKDRGTQGWNGSAWVAEPCQDSQRGRVRDALSCHSHCPRPPPRHSRQRWEGWTIATRPALFLLSPRLLPTLEAESDEFLFPLGTVTFCQGAASLKPSLSQIKSVPLFCSEP